MPKQEGRFPRIQSKRFALPPRLRVQGNLTGRRTEVCFPPFNDPDCTSAVNRIGILSCCHRHRLSSLRYHLDLDWRRLAPGTASLVREIIDSITSTKSAVKRLPGYAEPGGNFGLGKTQVKHSLGLLHVLSTELWGLDVLALGLGQGDALGLAFPDQVALELGEGRHDPEHQGFDWRGPVLVHGDAFLDELHRGTLGRNFIDQVEQVPGTAPEAVHRGHPDSVTLTDVVQQLRQAGALGTGLATDLVGEDLRALSDGF